MLLLVFSYYISYFCLTKKKKKFAHEKIKHAKLARVEPTNLESHIIVQFVYFLTLNNK